MGRQCCHSLSAIVDQILFIFVSRFCLFCAFTRPRYQVSVYRTIGSLVLLWHSLERKNIAYRVVAWRNDTMCFPFLSSFTVYRQLKAMRRLFGVSRLRPRHCYGVVGNVNGKTSKKSMVNRVASPCFSLKFYRRRHSKMRLVCLGLKWSFHTTILHQCGR